MTRDNNTIQDLNRLMGVERQQLAKLVQEIRDDERRLEQAREHYSHVAQRVSSLNESVESKRHKAFALKIDLMGKQQAKRTVARENRHCMRVPYELHVNFGGLRAFYSGFAINVSDGGMMVATCDPPEVGRQFAVEFTLGDGRIIRAPVQTVWSKQVTGQDEAGLSVTHVGLQFIGMLPEDADTLARYNHCALRSATPRSSDRS